MVSEHPEHDKLKKISHLSQAIHDFLEWCEGKNVYLMKEHPENYGPAWYEWVDLRKLLAEHFEIDLSKIEDEKRAMLDRQRKLNEEMEK